MFRYLDERSRGQCNNYNAMSAGDEGWLSRKVSRVTRRIVNVMLLLTLASSNIRSRHQMVQRQHYNWAERKQEATIQLLHLHLMCDVRDEFNDHELKWIYFHLHAPLHCHSFTNSSNNSRW